MMYWSLFCFNAMASQDMRVQNPLFYISLLFVTCTPGAVLGLSTKSKVTMLRGSPSLLLFLLFLLSQIVSTIALPLSAKNPLTLGHEYPFLVERSLETQEFPQLQKREKSKAG
jgi:hypothetical protein